MRYRTRIALAIKGDRVEKGVEVELTEKDFAQFDRNDFEPVGKAVEAPEPEAEPAIEDMTLQQLRDKAAALELSTSGTKADLQERITLHLDPDEEN